MKRQFAKKLVLISLTSLTIFYACFPWLAEFGIKVFLPANWDLQSIDIGYPDPQGLEIKSLQLKVEFGDTTISNLRVDYGFDSFKADSLSFFSKGKKTSSEESALVPVFQMIEQIQKLLELPPIKQMIVAQLNLQVGKEQWSFPQFQIDFPQKNLAMLAFSLPANPYFAKATSVSVHLTGRKKQLEMQLDLDQKKLLQLIASQENDNQQLDIAFSPWGINSLLKQREIDLRLQENLSIQINQNDFQLSVQSDAQPAEPTQSVGQTGIKISYQGLVSQRQSTNEFFLDFIAVSSDQYFPFNFDWQSRLSTAQLPLEVLKISDLSLTSKGKLRISREQVLLSASAHQLAAGSVELPTKQLKLTDIKSHWTLSDIDLNDLASTQLKGDIQSLNLQLLDDDLNKKASVDIKGRLELNNLNAILLNGKLQLEDFRFDTIENSEELTARLEIVDFDPKLNRGNIQLEIIDANGKLLSFSSQELRLSSSMKLQSESLQGSGKIQLDQQRLTPFQFTLDQEPIKANVSVRQQSLPIELINTIINQLKPKKWPKIALQKAQLTLDSDSSWLQSSELKSNELKSNSQLQISQANIQVGKNRLRNLSTILNISLNQQLSDKAQAFPLQIKSLVNLEKIELASGLILSDISFSIDKSPQALAIKQLSAQLFSGEVSTESLIFEGKELAPALVKGQQISLTELIFFSELESLFATGNINFELPLSMEKGSLIVQNASFQSTAPGILKYQSGTVLTPEENIALFALQDFHYTQLSGTLDYQDKSGEYQLKIHLLGANPALYDGYPIDFTMNINGALPGAFKSLFLSGDFNEAIINSIKTKS